MSVHCKKDGRWYVSWRNNAGSQKTKTFGRGDEAEKQAREFNDSLGLRPKRKIQGIQFSELTQLYINSKHKDWPEDSMISWLAKFKSIILPVLGHKEAMSFNERMLDAYCANRLKNVKAITVWSDLTLIMAVLNWAANPRRKHIPYNPVAGYQKPKRDDAIITPPKQWEIDKMIEHCPNHVFRALTLSYFTGLRPGKRELFSMTWDDIDLIDRTITIRSAKKRGLTKRTLPIVDADFYQVLTDWSKEDNCRYIVHWRGKQIKSMKKAFGTAKKKAEITRRIRPYDMRHAFATYALRNGADLKSVSNALGHTRTETTTRTYQHIDFGMMQDAVGRLPGLTIGSSKKEENVVNLQRYRKEKKTG